MIRPRKRSLSRNHRHQTAVEDGVQGAFRRVLIKNLHLLRHGAVTGGQSEPRHRQCGAADPTHQ